MSSSTPIVLVLMAVHNGERWLSEQVASILAQEGVVVRLVISVDTSTDASLALCENISSNEHRVSVIGDELRHGSATQNFLFLSRTVDFESADFIAFSDQDDLWDHDKLKRSIQAMEVNKAEAVSSDVTAFWPNGRQRLIVKSQTQRKFDFVLEAAGPGSTYLMSRQFWIDFRVWLSGRDLADMPPHDWLIYAFGRINGRRWHIMKESTVLYRQHDDNFLGANLGFKGRLARIDSIVSGAFRADVERLSKVFGDDFPIAVSRPALLRNLFNLRRKRSEAIVFGVLCALFW